MKRLLKILGSLSLLTGLLSSPLPAQDDPIEAPAAEAEVEKISIPELLGKVKYVTKVQPKKKVTLYYFLRSHSRCGFCRKIVPTMNALYKEMKNKGAEIIMLSGDPDTDTAKAWADEMEITIPMVTPETASLIASKVPGGGSGGSPNIMTVMADGEQLEGCSGANACSLLVADWKLMVKNAKKAEAKKKAETAKAKKKTKKKKSKKTKAAA